LGLAWTGTARYCTKRPSASNICTLWWPTSTTNALPRTSHAMLAGALNWPWPFAPEGAHEITLWC
jgi:hypothetical protein